MKTKKNAAEIKDRISDLKDRIEKSEQKRKKNKNVDETLKIIGKILDQNERAQRFALALEVDERKSESKPEESIAEGLKLKRGRIAKIEEEGKNKL